MKKGSSTHWPSRRILARRHWGKRAEHDTESELFTTGAWLVIAILFSLLMFGWTMSIVSQNSLQKNYLARDIALLIDAAHALAGDAIITYPFDLLTYPLQVADGKVSVGIDDYPASYPYLQDASFLPINALVRATSIDVTKTGKSMTLTAHGRGMQTPLTCKTDKPSTGLASARIIIDPAYGGTDHGPIGRITGKDATLAVAQALAAELRSPTPPATTATGISSTTSTSSASGITPLTSTVPGAATSVAASASSRPVPSSVTLTRDTDMDLDETSREALAAGYDLRVTIAVGNGPEYQNEITAATPTYLSTLGCRVVNSIILDPLLQLALISGRGLMTSSTPGHIILFLGNVHSQDEERLLANTPALAKAIADGIGDYYAGTSDGVAVSAGGPAALTPEQLQGRENIPLQELPATYSLGHVQLAPQASAAFIAMAEALFSEQASLLQAKQGYLDLLGAQECVQHHQDAPIESCGVPGSSLYHFGTEVQLADSTPDDVLTWLAQHAGEYGFASIDKHLSFSALASERASTMASAITPDMYCSLEQAMWESIGQQAHCSIESSSPSSGAASIPGGRS